MRAKTSKLKVWREGVSGGENCLSWDALEKLAGEASTDLKSNHHVAACPHCQAELVMLRTFNSSPAANDEKAVEWVAAQLQNTQNAPVQSLRAPLWRTLLRVPNLAGAAALTLLIGLGLSLYLSSRPARPVLHGAPSEVENMRSGDIRVAGPSGDLDRTPEDFRWYALPLAKSYTLQLLEVDGTVLWTGQSTRNVLKANPELKSKITPGKQLLWKVSALDASGRPIGESSQIGFRVTPVKR